MCLQQGDEESSSYRASFEGEPLEWLEWSLLSGIFVNFICGHQNIERNEGERNVESCKKTRPRLTKMK